MITALNFHADELLPEIRQAYAEGLVDEGYREPWWSAAPGYVSIEANATRYCIQAQHKDLAPSNEWRRSTFDSDNPRPLESPDVCPEL